jgi:hypothetical protein
MDYFLTVRPCKPLKVMYMRGGQTCFGGLGGRSRTETCDSSLEPAWKCGFNARQYVQVAPRHNNKRVMRGEAEIDAKSSKIDDQKFQNSPDIGVFARFCYRSLVLLDDSMLIDGQSVTCLQIHVNPRILPVHLLYF